MTQRTVPLRVLVVDHTAQTSGAEIAVARLLHALDRTRVTPSVLLLADGPLQALLVADGVRTAVLPAPGALVEAGRHDAFAGIGSVLGALGRSLALVPALARAVRGADVDLVVANSLKSAVLLAAAAPLSGTRWVWHLHDRLADDYLPPAAARLLRMLARVGPRLVVANSHATAATLGGGRIMVAPPAPPRPHPAPRTPPIEPVFGLLGRIAPTKGHDVFLQAAAQVAARDRHVRFPVVGRALFNDGEYERRIRALPGRLGIADRVTFPGWSEDVTASMRAMTAVVHASPVPEPFGQVIVEAMLAGTPVIATDAGGATEILDPHRQAVALADGVSRTPFGLLVDPGRADALAAAMAWMIAEPEQREGMAERARDAAADRFDPVRTAATVTEAWDRAVTGGRRSDWMDA